MPRQEKNIYQRKDGRWEGRYIKGRMETGKAVYGYVYAHTYEEVKKKERRSCRWSGSGKVKEKCPKKGFRGGCCHRMALFIKTADQKVHVLQVSYLGLQLYHSGTGTEGY